MADVHAGWIEALQGLGVRTLNFNFDDRLTLYDAAYLDTGTRDAAGHPLFRKAMTGEQAVDTAARWLFASCFTFWPDILLLVSGFLLPVEILDIIRDRRIKVAVLHTELPYELDRELDLAQHADLSLLNDPVHLDRFREVTRAAYLPHAYRPTMHHPGPAEAKLACDFAFVGTAFQSRIDFLSRMDLDGLDVLLAGNWQRLEGTDSPLLKHLAHDIDQCLDNVQTADVYRSARAGLNLYRRETTDGGTADGWAMGPREVEMAACGLFFLRDPRPEGDEVLGSLPTFDSPEDASEQLRWWLDPARDLGRAQRAEHARQAVEDRTFTANATQLLRLLDK